MKQYQKMNFLELVKLLFPGEIPWYTPKRARVPIRIQIEGIAQKGSMLGYHLDFQLRPNREFSKYINGIIELLPSKKLEMVLDRYLYQKALIFRGVHSFKESYYFNGIDNYYSLLFIEEILPAKGEIGGLSTANQTSESGLLTIIGEEK